MSYQIQAKVLENKEVAPGVCRMFLQAPRIAKDAVPGQFLHIRIEDRIDPLLRRPLSIHGVHKEQGTVSLLYRVVGGGTLRLSEKLPGDNLDILGPLGVGFTLKAPPPDACLAVIAGGMGIAPMLFLLQELALGKSRVLVFLGAQSKDSLLCEKEISLLGYTPRIATDDGSRGYKGLVTDLLAGGIVDKTVCFAYACGPPAMLKQVAGVLGRNKIPGELSLEERMGCGLGACLSCVCKIKDPLTPEGHVYKRACTEGPVFSAGEVLFE